MTIKKQEFYEGAALHLLARSGKIVGITYESPFFLLNDRLIVFLKYSTRGRSPWGFTFTPNEQEMLRERALQRKTVIALICGSDGIAAFTYEAYALVAISRNSAIHIACYRDHGEQYEVNGPDGRLSGKVSPADWRRILDCEGAE